MNPNLNSWLFVIPSRLASVRLARKPLADLGGKPLVARVYDRVRRLEEWGGELVVAIDHPEVEEVCQKYKIPYVMTSPDLPSGTDRVHAAAKMLKTKRPMIVNIQGDEPFIGAEDIAQLAQTMQAERSAMGSLYFVQNDATKFATASIVKVVCDAQGHALYFSRSEIPHHRDKDTFKSFKQHLGVYGFTMPTLEKFCSMKVSELESTEKLEQLRALEAGIKIRMVEAKVESVGIDTPEDLERARKHAW